VRSTARRISGALVRSKPRARSSARKRSRSSSRPRRSWTSTGKLTLRCTTCEGAWIFSQWNEVRRAGCWARTRFQASSRAGGLNGPARVKRNWTT